MAIQRSPVFYFALAIILLFGLSLFGVVLSVPNNGGSPSVTPGQDSAQYKGFGVGNARVGTLGSQLVVQCGSPAADAVSAIESVEGVSTAFKAGSELIVVVVNVSKDAGQVARTVAAAAVTRCTKLRVLRSSLVELVDSVVLQSNPDSATQGSRTLYPLEARGYGQETANLAGVPAYLDAITTTANATVAVYVSATYAGTKLIGLILEQQGVGEITDAPPVPTVDGNVTDVNGTQGNGTQLGDGNSAGGNGSNLTIDGSSSNSSN